MPARHPKRGRLWLNDGSCIRLRPAYGNHVWAYDFVFERTREGRPLKFLTVVDEFTRQCQAIEVARQQSSRDVLRMLAGLMLRHGIPQHIRSDNGPEFVAKAVREWLSRLGVETLFIEPGSPWENGYIESFNGKLRDELLNGEIFTTLQEAQVLTEVWRREYDQVRPHSCWAIHHRCPKRRSDRSSQPHPNSGCGYIGGGKSPGLPGLGEKAVWGSPLRLIG